MNEIVEVSHNLPDTIEDLTQFVLVGKAKLDAYMLKLRTINKLSTAQEIRDQTLKEAQEVSTALIAAEQRIGELLLSIPKRAGGVNQYNKEEKSNRTEKTKTETAKEMGYTRHEVSDYQQMAKNPETVQRVLEEAIENGTVVTKTQVMKEIRAVKAESEARIRELENRKPEIKEVIKEVVPADYEELKRKAKKSDAHKSDFQYMQGQYQEMAEKWKKAEHEKDALIAEMNKPEAQEKRELHLSAFHFCMGVASFLEQYGGYAYLMKEIDALDEKERERIMNAVRSIRDWADTMSNEVVTEVIV